MTDDAPLFPMELGVFEGIRIIETPRVLATPWVLTDTKPPGVFRWANGLLPYPEHEVQPRTSVNQAVREVMWRWVE